MALVDLLKDLEGTKAASPRKVIEELVASWISEKGSGEQKKDIMAYAKDNNLEFMLPSDWFDDYMKEEPIKKAGEEEDEEGKEGEKKVGEEDVAETEDIDANHIVFTMTANTKTADFIRELKKKIKDANLQDAEKLVIKLVIDDTEMKDAIVVDKPGELELMADDEDYVRHTKEEEESFFEKAELLVSFTHEDTGANLEDILGAIRRSDKIVLDPENDSSSFDTSKLNDFSYRFEGNEVRIRGEQIAPVKDILTAIKELGNGGHSFTILADSEEAAYWDGDGHDRLEDITLKKAEDLLQKYYSNRYIFEDSYTPIREWLLMIQEAIVPYGAIVNYVDKFLICVQYQELVHEIIKWKLDDLGLGGSRVLESYVDNKGIHSVYIDVTPTEFFQKAKKGSEGYEEWLRKYKEKRGQKKDEEDEKKIQKRVADILSVSFEDEVDRNTLMESMRNQWRAMQREEALERMLDPNQRRRDSKGRYIKKED